MRVQHLTTPIPLAAFDKPERPTSELGHSGLSKPRASATGSRPRGRTTWASVSPATYSITRTGVPSCSNRSSTRTTRGELGPAARCASRWSRWRQTAE